MIKSLHFKPRLPRAELPSPDFYNPLLNKDQLSVIASPKINIPSLQFTKHHSSFRRASVFISLWGSPCLCSASCWPHPTFLPHLGGTDHFCHSTITEHTLLQCWICVLHKILCSLEEKKQNKTKTCQLEKCTPWSCMSINPGSSTFYYAYLVRLLKSLVKRNKNTSYFIEL